MPANLTCHTCNKFILNCKCDVSDFFSPEALQEAAESAERWQEERRKQRAARPLVECVVCGELGCTMCCCNVCGDPNCSDCCSECGPGACTCVIICPVCGDGDCGSCCMGCGESKAGCRCYADDDDAWRAGGDDQDDSNDMYGLDDRYS